MKPDSGHLAAFGGGAIAWVAAHFHFGEFSAGLAGLVGTAYTLWKWRREAKQPLRR